MLPPFHLIALFLSFQAFSISSAFPSMALLGRQGYPSVKKFWQLASLRHHRFVACFAFYFFTSRKRPFLDLGCIANGAFCFGHRISGGFTTQKVLVVGRAQGKEKFRVWPAWNGLFLSSAFETFLRSAPSPLFLSACGAQLESTEILVAFGWALGFAFSAFWAAIGLQPRLRTESHRRSLGFARNVWA